MKDRIKRFIIKTCLDSIGIFACALGAQYLPNIVPAIKGAEMLLAVAFGIWLYMPIRSGIDSMVAKYIKK